MTHLDFKKLVFVLIIGLSSSSLSMAGGRISRINSEHYLNNHNCGGFKSFVGKGSIVEVLSEATDGAYFLSSPGVYGVKVRVVENLGCNPLLAARNGCEGWALALYLDPSEKAIAVDQNALWGLKFP